MILQEFYIKEYDWTIYILYSKSKYCKSVIDAQLQALKCDEQTKTTIFNILNNNPNLGLTYTNPIEKKSLIVFSTQDLLVFKKEQIHSIMHISEALGLKQCENGFVRLKNALDKIFDKLIHSLYIERE